MARATKSRVAVIGLGFVGLTTALGFARKGFTVRGFDASARTAKSLRAGRLLFHEPHLPEQLHALAGKRFFICGSLAEAVADADVIFYCVGTPQSRSGAADVSFLQRAVSDTLKALPPKRKPILVIKSTMPPGALARSIMPLFKRAGRMIGRDIGLANNPEFLREGRAWGDFIRPDRVVVGAGDDLSYNAVAKLYQPFRTRVCRVTPGTAEFIKSVSNALLATLISFANETSMVADAVGGIDLKTAFQTLHLDRRWSGAPANMTSYLYPGCGFGGYCLPKDIAALLFAARAAGVKADVLRGVISANNAIVRHFVGKIVRATAPRTRIGILGLSFKPGSDDVRETPAARIIEQLLKSGRKNIVAYDPMASESYRRVYHHPIKYADSLTKAVRQAGAVVVLTAWPEFRAAKKQFAGKPVFDGRYCL
ncbi:MAG TPA: nucleotide sugar dehydrogenase [Candidatus Nitrosopolaris sp.]|nr:nucleotide sugar dehydrogenase [Candidatus Nitrosopolaris sp.]